MRGEVKKLQNSLALLIPSVVSDLGIVVMGVVGVGRLDQGGRHAAAADKNVSATSRLRRIEKAAGRLDDVRLLCGS